MNIIIPFAGGLGMFIYGMQIMAQGLENAAGDKMKTLLEVLTKNKFLGVLLGAFITAVIQSSSATTVMVVGFVNAGLMNLSQAMGVIMGANIGTTVTGWLVSSSEWAKYLSPATLAPLAIFIGVIIMLTGKRFSTKEVANIIIGFGLLFVGINLMSTAVAPLKESPEFVNLFAALGHNPLLGIFAGAFVTAIIQSSSASVGILQSLAAAGLVPFNAAIYIIMGQNIGTCATALLSGLGANKNAKAASLMHLLFNIIGTVIFSTVSIVYISVMSPEWALGSITQTEISLIHTIFNITTTVLLFPVSDWIIKLAVRIGHADETPKTETKALLDDRIMETPGIAIQSVRSEVIRMGCLVEKSLMSAGEVLLTKDKEVIARIKEEEAEVDKITGEISEYAVKLSSLKISEKEHLDVIGMLKAVAEMERVSDQCENIAEFAEQLIVRNTEFTDEARENIKKISDVCIESYIHSLNAYINNDKDSVYKCIEKETEADSLETEFRNKNIERMTTKKCDGCSVVIFQDVLVSMERISDHARNIAEGVLEDIK